MMSLDCQSCGGCCAYSHTWLEFREEDTCDGIPEEMCDCETGRMKCDGDRCVALAGKIGQRVSCSTYEHRPSVCREFMPGSGGCRQVQTFFKL
ncbi:YkgJ family cysteine cluster protein [Burkholderia multivorans]|uniref:YkgJ family cysteine cluster protein n=2 Tax=Burkholderia multivorans TaxID=87883 RepID=UPI00338D9744